MVKDLAVAVFGWETLATHRLSGSAGNANKAITKKPALDQDKVMLILGGFNVLLFHFAQILCYSAKLHSSEIAFTDKLQKNSQMFQ